MSGGGKKLSYHRKLWGLHLDPYMSSISYIVQNFLACSSNDLQQMLRRVCAQLADINADLATLVTQQVHRSLLSVLVESPIAQVALVFCGFCFICHLTRPTVHILKDYSFHFFMEKPFTRYVLRKKTWEDFSA